LRCGLGGKFALFLILVLALPSRAWANAAPPWRAGSPVGELTGVKDVVIERERLEIDLRPLADGGQAMIYARYNLRNDGAARDIELVFVAGSPVGDESGVQVNGATVPYARAEMTEVPRAWRPPATTPSITGEGTVRGLEYKTTRNQDGLKFTASLEPGANQIQVHYRALPGAYSGREPTRYWQLAYILAPAREWGGFGTLDVTVYLAPDWRAASEPRLMRDGDILGGFFGSIPADALALTVQAPPPSEARIWSSYALAGAAWVGAAVGGLVLTWRLGRGAGKWAANRGRSTWWALPGALLAGVIWTALLIGAVFLSTVGQKSLAVPEAQQAWNQGYGMVMAFFVFSVLCLAAVPLGLALAQVAAVRAHRRLTSS
jgi:hypothetical protein